MNVYSLFYGFVSRLFVNFAVNETHMVNKKLFIVNEYGLKSMKIYGNIVIAMRTLCGLTVPLPVRTVRRSSVE